MTGVLVLPSKCGEVKHRLGMIAAAIPKTHIRAKSEPIMYLRKTKPSRTVGERNASISVVDSPKTETSMKKSRLLGIRAPLEKRSKLLNYSFACHVP